jgi:hypothetical protein
MLVKPDADIHSIFRRIRICYPQDLKIKKGVFFQFTSVDRNFLVIVKNLIDFLVKLKETYNLFSYSFPHLTIRIRYKIRKEFMARI